MSWEKIPESRSRPYAIERYVFVDSLKGGRFRRDPEPLLVPCRVLGTSLEAARVFDECLRGLAHEEFWVLGLDQECRAQKIVRAAVGSEGGVELDGGRAVRAAMIAGCGAVVVAHHHPCGDPMPSLTDWCTTRELLDGLCAVGFELVDHLVLGDGVYASLRSLNEPMFTAATFTEGRP